MYTPKKEHLAAVGAILLSIVTGGWLGKKNSDKKHRKRMGAINKIDKNLDRQLANLEHERKRDKDIIRQKLQKLRDERGKAF